MRKRAPVAPPMELHHQYETPKAITTNGRSIRKRKRTGGAGAGGAGGAGGGGGAGKTMVKTLRMSASNGDWHENDDEDEDSSSNDTTTPAARPARNHSNKHANNSSILLNTSLSSSADTHLVNESPKPVYTLHPSVINGTILYDLMQKPWRLGRPIGKGNFGEIFLASDNVGAPVTKENAKYVVKIEPHSNGPLFVEIHCLINTAKKNPAAPAAAEAAAVAAGEHARDYKVQAAGHLPEVIPPTGIPNYIASGSHYFGNARYRFLVLQRFDRDLHSLIKNCRVHQKSVLTLAIQIVRVLEKLHNKGYCHNDVKAQNLMISRCKFCKGTSSGAAARPAPEITKPKSSVNLKHRFDEHYEEKQQTTDSGNSSEQEANDDDDDADYIIERPPACHSKDDEDYEQEDEEDEDFDDGATTNSNNSNSMDNYKTPVNKKAGKKGRGRNAVVEFSGSNPVRSCRRQKRNSIYEEMVKSHYLRPTKRVSYAEFFNEDGASLNGELGNPIVASSDDESEEFLPDSMRRTVSAKKAASAARSAATSRTKTTFSKRLTRHQEKLLTKEMPQHAPSSRAATAGQGLVTIEEERIFLIDFGLASKFMDNGVHRPFVMDQRRAHDGTLEFTSRDAHMGAHSRRSDLECLGYNLIFWSQGYLPWKEAAVQHQQEKVHRAKEYLMTDVREMLRQIYGKQVPKYLGEFLHLVGQLAYHDQPDYERYRRLFEREYQQLGYTLADMRLDSEEIARTCVRVKEEIENKNDFFEMGKHHHCSGGSCSNNNNCSSYCYGSHALSIMKNLSVGTPFHERTLSNRVSPKNLRSKSDKKSLKKKKFSWALVLSQDPDQIARERAEKEFDREEDLSEVQQPTVRRYDGKPTYAILEILRLTGRVLPADKPNNDAVKDEDTKDAGNVRYAIEGDADVDMEHTEECDETEGDDEDDEDDGDDDDDEEIEASEGEDDEDCEGYEEEASGEEDEDNDEDEDEDCEIKEEAETDDEELVDDDDDEDEDEEEDEQESEDERKKRKINGRKKYALDKSTAGAAAATAIVSTTTSRPGTRSRDSKTKTTTARTAATAAKATTTTTTTGTRSSSSCTTTTTTATNRKRGSGSGSGSSSATTRANRNTSTTVISVRRGQLASAAAGELEQASKQCLQKYGVANGGSGGKHLAERRTRKRRTKTEATVVIHEGSGGDSGDSGNAHFAANVRQLYNVWKSFNNESIYMRGSAAATAIARHYRK